MILIYIKSNQTTGLFIFNSPTCSSTSKVVSEIEHSYVLQFFICRFCKTPTLFLGFLIEYKPSTWYDRNDSTLRKTSVNDKNGEKFRFNFILNNTIQKQERS